ncbi:MAG: YgeY family selenium metabolism-linked hydrolase [Candidatus Zhuqueibacterota bacterium]
MTSETMIESIRRELAAEQNELYSVLQRLIQIRSYSGDEKEIVEYIIATMKAYDFDACFIDQLGNAVGRIGSGPITILYDAHIDTVHVTESEKWPHPPFAGEMIDGKIFGRGAVDEKPAMAGFLLAGKVLQRLNALAELPVTIYVVGSVLEEDADGYPLHHLIANEGIRPGYVLLGEPTDLKVYRGQRGRMELNIRTVGKSAHGAHNSKGINAIYKMNPIISEIERLDQSLPAIAPLGKGSITVSQVVSRAPSLCSVPDFCEIHLDRRMTMGESKESIVGQLQEIIQRLRSDARVSIPTYTGVSWTGLPVNQDAYFPTWLFDENHPIVTAGLRAAEFSSRKKTASGFWSFSTNGVETAGRLGIPTIGFAPGKEELSHSPHEELVLTDLLKAAQFYGAFPFYLANAI